MREWAGVSVKFGAQVAEEAEAPPSRLIRPKRVGECHDVRVQSPRLGSPSRPGSEHETRPQPLEPWLVAAHQATNVLQRSSGSFKAARQPPSPRAASHPPRRRSTAGWQGRCRRSEGVPSCVGSSGSQPCHDSEAVYTGKHHAHVFPTTPSTWLF